MDKGLTAKTFDYSVIEDKDTKGKLVYLEGQIKKKHSGVAESIVDIGKDLTTARDALGDHHNGTFLKWIENACGFSKSTAYRYMDVFTRFGGSLPTVGRLEDTAMYALAVSSVPKKAVDEATKLADKGVHVTGKLAKELIEKHKPDSKPEAKPKPPKTTPKPQTECPVSKAKHSWVSDGSGQRYCEHCKEDHPENVKEEDSKDKITTQRQKTVKTVEALMRAFDDLNDLLPQSAHKNAIRACKELLETAKAWK